MTVLTINHIVNIKFHITGQSIEGTSISSRMVLITLMMVALLMSTHYTSWLYSILTVFVPVYPFDSFQSILKDGSYTVGINEGVSVQTELKVFIYKYK